VNDITQALYFPARTKAFIPFINLTSKSSLSCELYILDHCWMDWGRLHRKLPDLTYHTPKADKITPIPINIPPATLRVD
jgi:hypothetical protein